MTKTRNLSDLLDSNGDVKSTALDNVPASNDASALTTGTLPDARLSTNVTQNSSTQTLTNKTIDASSNTLSNIPNSALANSSITINGSATALGGSATINTDLVNDASPELGADLSTNGNNINFGDNDKAYFGASNDLEIYHSGTQSIIEDVGTGQLQLRSNGIGIYLQKANSEYLARFLTDGTSELYYDSAKKLETTSAGVTVTGTLSATAFSGDGSGLTGISGGKVGQAVQTVKTDTASTASSTFSAISGLSATITPSSSSSKILASVNLQVGQSSSTTAVFKLYRGTQAVGYGGANGSRQTVGFRVSPNNVHWTFPVSYQYLDSPSTTSAVTYYVYWRNNGNTVYINRNDSFGNDSSNDASLPISTITLMEILP